MKVSKLIKLAVAAMVLVAAGVNAKPAVNAKLSIVQFSSMNYQCSDKTQVSASYYQLSDESLDFVKFSHKGKMYTLPQLMAASGARYANDFGAEWWTSGNEATLTLQRDNALSKEITCKELVAPPKKTSKSAK